MSFSAPWLGAAPGLLAPEDLALLAAPALLLTGYVLKGNAAAGRFRELDNRAFSEYYLIGTLASLLFAAATGLAVRLALRGSL